MKATKSTKDTKRDKSAGILCLPLPTPSVWPAPLASVLFVLFVAFSLPVFSGCSLSIEEPPMAARHTNYLSAEGYGSCAYAAAEDLLAMHGRGDLAARVRREFAGPAIFWRGEGCPSLIDLAKRLGLDFRYIQGRSTPAGEAWLQLVSDDNLGAVIQWVGTDDYGRPDYGCHAVTFCGFDADGYAWILDSNDPWAFGRVAHDEFLATWSRCGGCAFTFVFPGAAEEEGLAIGD